MNLQQINDVTTGVWAMFLRKKNAMSYFTINLNNFIWSFSVVVLVLMFQLYMSSIDTFIFDEVPNPQELGMPSIAMLVTTLLIGWFSWPIVAYVICKLMQLEQHYIRYVTIDNWCSMVGVTILAAPFILFQFGLPLGMARSFIFVSTFLLLIYKWRIAQISLATTGLNASILLFIDVAFSVILSMSVKSIFFS